VPSPLVPSPVMLLALMTLPAVPLAARR